MIIDLLPDLNADPCTCGADVGSMHSSDCWAINDPRK
jgi:hypothetical protein